jgi:hypothetical protein
MFEVANRCGRLLEIRVASPFSLDDAGALFKQIYRVMKRDRGLALVMADLRGLRIVDPEIIDMVTVFMRQDNPYVERNAFLISTASALLQIQSDRMLKQTGSPTRRSFSRRGDAEAWLSEPMNAEERARLNRFLDEVSDF